jgi:hypothetical protein
MSVMIAEKTPHEESEGHHYVSSSQTETNTTEG